MNAVRRIAEVMRRAVGQRRWRTKQLVARTGLQWATVWRALRALEAEGVVEKDGVDWIWNRKEGNRDKEV